MYKRQVWHPSEYYAGGIDAVARTEDGELVVIDFKTGGLYDEAAYQLAAYAVALEELTGERCGRHGWYAYHATSPKKVRQYSKPSNCTILKERMPHSIGHYSYGNT